LRSDILDKKDGVQNSLFTFISNVYTDELSQEVIIRILSDDIDLSVGKDLGFMNIYKERVDIYKSNKDYQAALNESLPLSFTLNKDMLYSIGFDKREDSVSFFIREIEADKNVLKEFKRTYSAQKDPYQLLMWGKPFFAVRRGEVKLLDSWITAPFHNPVLSIFGDSFVEGTMLLINGIDRKYRWSSMLTSVLGKERCLIDGKGGEMMSDEFINRFKIENSWYKTKYVILALGTNNYLDVEKYKKYMLQAISILRNNGQIPVLLTVTPRKDRDYEPVKLINDWIKSMNIKYIDMHEAVTKENDPTQWRDGYLFYDGIHPTPNGYKAMYEQVLKDLPEIFKEDHLSMSYQNS
ncbi:SGNH/GDSL hydrolase family protein, partial [Parabacteroides distasonis]